MNDSETLHEFFDSETKNNNKLYQAFCNHVHFNQWQAARLCLELLYQRNSAPTNNLVSLLIDIIQNPTAYWFV